MLEIRNFTNLSSASNENGLIVEGLVNKTNSWSRVLGNRKKFRERIKPGVFSRALSKTDNVEFLYEHRKDMLLASTKSNTLNLVETSEGLEMRAEICPTSYGQDAFQLINSKLVSNMSFGFKVLKESWQNGFDGIAERTIEDMEITEVSVVKDPCYVQSIIEARGIELVTEVEIPQIKETKGEKRNMNETTTITKGMFTPGKEVNNITMGEITLPKIFTENEILSKMQTLKAEHNGKCHFPHISKEGIKFTTLEDGSIISEEPINTSDYDSNISLVECQTYPLMARKKIRSMDIDMSEEQKNEMFSKILDRTLLEMTLFKLGQTIDKVNLLNEGNPSDYNIDSLDELIFSMESEYLRESYLLMNEATLKKFCILKKNTGEFFFEIEKNDITNEKRYFYRDIEILVQDNLESVVLVNPTTLGMGIGRLEEQGKMVDTVMRRAGYEGQFKSKALGLCVIDNLGIKSKLFIAPTN